MPTITYPLTHHVLAALAVALIISFIATPPVKRFAQRVGAIDVPEDNRRIHKVPIPRLGGLAIFIGFVISVVIWADINREIQGVLLGALLIVSIGAIDDIVPLRSWQKLGGQIVAALIPIFWGGVVIDLISNPNIFAESSYLPFGFMAIPLTVIWIVGITNAVNLIDGLDGLASGVTTIASLSIAYAAFISSGHEAAVLSMLALAGGALGFLPFNFHPAKIFMGDSGALFLGFMLATLSIEGATKSATVIALIVPVLVLGVPIFDTAFAILRRMINKKPIMEADKDHLHHRIMAVGLGHKRAVLLLYGISGVMGVAAVLLGSSLYVEPIALIAIAATLIYVFLSGSGDDKK